MTTTRRCPDKVNVAPLVKHMAKSYSDYHIARSIEAVLDACRNESARELVGEYAKARKKASPWNPRHFEGAKARNSHRAIPAKALDAIHIRAARIDAGLMCLVCGELFESKRADAKFCGGNCRQRAKRLAGKGIVIGRTVNGKDPCPHDSTLGQCPDIWCRSRIEDLDGEFHAPELRAPEQVDEVPEAV